MRPSRAAVLGMAGVAALALGIGCARRPNAALEHARAAMDQANQTPEITTNGAVALHEAQQELDRADRAYKSGKDDVVVDHHAYMTERKIDIARANAEQKVAEQELARLNDQRSQVVIQSRTGEAAAAREEAASTRDELRRMQEQMRSLNPRETDRGTLLTVSNVVFETNRAELKPGAMQDLNNLATFLRQHPDRQVMIEGHTDDTGTAEYNRQLSEERANAVRDYLVRNGVAASQVQTHGYGESYPVATNATESGRQRNRRVDIVVSPTGATAGVGREGPATGHATSGAARDLGTTTGTADYGTATSGTARDPGTVTGPTSGRLGGTDVGHQPPPTPDDEDTEDDSD
jgi:outer membrane protein OmpA-like peptidoglycan-associated protein